MNDLAAAGGPAILGALYNGVKTLQLYPAENDAVRRALAEVEAHASRLFDREGGLSIWVAGNYIFLNDLQVKLGLADYASLAALRESLRAHGIGRIDVQPRIRKEEWAAFLSALGSDPSPGHPPLESLRARLEAAGVTHLQVGPPSPLFEGREGLESVEAAHRTYAYSVKVAKEMMTGLVLGKAIGARRAQRAVLRVVDQVLQDRASMLGMLTLRDYDDHSLIHAVNVSILSVALGDHLGFSKANLFELGFAALFHDIGKVLIPTGVLNKEGWLNEEEWRLVSQHPDFGLLMLFNVEGFDEPPYRAMLAAYEHHMKTDLSGYPRVIRRRRQSLFARIISLTESYDAAISRYSKQFLPCSPDEAIRQLRESESGAYDRVLVRAFVNMMGIYPVATLVILDTGELAVVVAPNPNPRAIHRPMVRIVAGADGLRTANGPIRDLTEVDPETGRPRRTIARSTDPQRYGIRISDFVA
jgi:HD-GYP domain-containing protein (c-di-GMP phosphodiesterase class II)